MDPSRTEVYQAVDSLHDEHSGELLAEHHVFGSGYRYHCESCKHLVVGFGPSQPPNSYEFICPKCGDSTDIIHLGRAHGNPWCESCKHDLAATEIEDWGYGGGRIWGKCITENCESCKSPPSKVLMWAAGEAGERFRLWDNSHDARKQWNRIHDEHGSSWWEHGDKSEKLAKAVIKKIWVPVS